MKTQTRRLISTETVLCGIWYMQTPALRSAIRLQARTSRPPIWIRTVQRGTDSHERRISTPSRGHRMFWCRWALTRGSSVSPETTSRNTDTMRAVTETRPIFCTRAMTQRALTPKMWYRVCRNCWSGPPLFSHPGHTGTLPLWCWTLLQKPRTVRWRLSALS